MTITIFVDGGCDPNPGFSAFAALLQFQTAEGRRLERLISGTEADSTNNRAEMMAALSGLQIIHDKGKFAGEIVVYSDSRYLIYTVTGHWNIGANGDLWGRLFDLIAEHKPDKALPWKIEWTWVRGHNGNPGNERCHAEVERLLRVHQANELVNGGKNKPGGERLSDGAWIDETISAHKKRRREMGLE